MNVLRQIGLPLRVRRQENAASPKSRPPEAYHVFSREFDVTVHAYELDSALGRLPPESREDQEKAWGTYLNALQNWRVTAQIAALEASAGILQAEKSGELKETLVTLLVDLSGSMKGQKILLAAATCDVAHDFLTNLGVKTEILGFTSVHWRGGKSRELWESRGKPQAPGRLTDTLHVIYKAAQKRSSGTTGHLLKPMLRSDLLKENVDGEALEWAISRQMETSARRRVVLVLTDGVPMDDSTLQTNGLDFLSRHLEMVIDRTEQEAAVELIGIGIGYDPSRYYKNSVTVSDINDLGKVLIAKLADVLRE